MNDQLLHNFKDVMIDIRSNTRDENLKHIVLSLQESIHTENESDKKYQEFEGVLSAALDILLNAAAQGQDALVYDLSDMLQGMPDLKYWHSSKNMSYYWKDYVKPVKRKWKLRELDLYQSAFRKSSFLGFNKI